VESDKQEGSERISGEDEDESEEEGEEEGEGAAVLQKPVQKKAAEEQKAIAEKSVQKKSAEKPATSPITGKKCKPATSQASPTAGKN
jgi:hypothetical protein